jgi:hypothetical protein
MKKLSTMLAAFVLVLGVTMPAQAAPLTITFSETGISATLPDYLGNTDVRYDGTQIDTEYSGIGVTWDDFIPANDGLTGQVVTTLSEFSGGTGTDPILWYYGTGGGGTTPVNANINLSVASNYLSFDHRRPNNVGTMQIVLYMNDGLVWDSGSDLEDLIPVTASWNTFTYTGDTFNRVNIIGSDKFLTDTYSFNMVPIPSAFWLLGSGLFFVIHRRKS